MNKVLYLSGEMGSSDTIEMVLNSDSNEGILIRNTEGFSDKGEEIRTSEYFLDVQDETVNGEHADSQFITIESSCEDNGDDQFIAVNLENSEQIILNNKNVIFWNEICRICANSSDRFIPIFSGEGLEHNLCNKINNYLPLKVSEDDSFPHQVCYNCAATLIAWHDMLTGCLDAQQQLEELQAKINVKDNFDNDTVTENNLENVRELDTINIEEKKIDLKEDSSMEIIETMGVLESDRSKIPQNVSTRFKEFRKTYKPTLTTVKSSKISQNQSKSMKRESTRSANKKRINKRVKNEATEDNADSSDKEIKDEYCVPESSNFCKVNLENTSLNDIKSSDRDKLEEKPECHLNSSQKKKVQSSKQKKVWRKQITAGLDCTHCGKKFRQYNSYQIHMRIHTGEKPYTCHICGKQFGLGGSLYYHLKHVHGGVKNHACDICGRCFAMKTAMEDHRRIHTGERPYVCHSCGKTFKTKASLYIHSKIHTDEYPFNCEFCKKVFRWKQQMISHLTTHTGEKNHICDICGKAFGVKNELTRHSRTHSLDKPFKCQKCGLSFGQKRYLTNHNRTRHKTKVSTS